MRNLNLIVRTFMVRLILLCISLVLLCISWFIGVYKIFFVSYLLFGQLVPNCKMRKYCDFREV